MAHDCCSDNDAAAAPTTRKHETTHMSPVRNVMPADVWTPLCAVRTPSTRRWQHRKALAPFFPLAPSRTSLPVLGGGREGGDAGHGAAVVLVCHQQQGVVRLDEPDVHSVQQCRQRPHIDVGPERGVVVAAACVAHGGCLRHGAGYGTRVNSGTGRLCVTIGRGKWRGGRTTRKETHGEGNTTNTHSHPLFFRFPLSKAGCEAVKSLSSAQSATAHRHVIVRAAASCEHG